MPEPLFMSSGDLIADRRFGYARDLQSRGDLAAAADLFAQAAELSPDFASAWFALGDLREQLGERPEAIAAFRQARRADPEDRHGAELRLMLLGAAALTRMPPGYVRALFDQYAPRYERALVEDLGYRGPAVLLEAVRAKRGRGRFARAIDLGCGTGLAARPFAADVESFIGIDLSPGMIARASATGLYAQLVTGDMVQGLGAQPAESADLVLAADAAVYLSDLAPVLREAARVLTLDGVMAFTVETHPGSGVRLGAGLRYAHAASYIRETIAAAGLRLDRLDALSTRNEDGVPAPGLVVVAVKC